LIASTHIATGALCGALSQYCFNDCPVGVQLGVAISTGIASHFVLDGIPHSECLYEIFKYKLSRFRFVLMAEIVLALCIAIFLDIKAIGYPSLGILVTLGGIGGGILPDFAVILTRFFPEFIPNFAYKALKFLAFLNRKAHGMYLIGMECGTVLQFLLAIAAFSLFFAVKTGL
jgi:hypothetical protein